MMNLIQPSSPHRGRLLALAFTLGAVSLAAAGCGGKAKNATVSGEVNYHGQPVTGGTLTLHPASGGVGFPVTINPDGKFKVSGAPMGEMKVTIETNSVRSMPQPGANPYGSMKPPPGKKVEAPKISVPTEGMAKYVKIPPKYQDVKTTPLTWNIQKGSETKTFDLTD